MPDRPFIGLYYRVTACTYLLRDGTRCQAYSVQTARGEERVLCFDLKQANAYARSYEHNERQQQLPL